MNISYIIEILLRLVWYTLSVQVLVSWIITIKLDWGKENTWMVWRFFWMWYLQLIISPVIESLLKGVWINFSTNKYVADTLTSSQAEANSSQEVIAMQGLSVPDGELQTYILQLLQTQVGVHKCVVVVWTLRLLQYWSLLLWGRLVLWWQQIPEGQCY